MQFASFNSSELLSFSLFVMFWFLINWKETQAFCFTKSWCHMYQIIIFLWLATRPTTNPDILLQMFNSAIWSTSCPCLSTRTTDAQRRSRFTTRPKIQSQSQIFRYGQSIFCLPHRPNFSDIFDLCLHWVSVVRASVDADSQKMLKTLCSICWQQSNTWFNNCNL